MAYVRNGREKYCSLYGKRQYVPEGDWIGVVLIDAITRSITLPHT